MKSIRASVLLLTFLVPNWLLTVLVLWWSYDLGSLIKGGFYQPSQAFSLAGKMALIVTGLIAAVWLFVSSSKHSLCGWRLGFNITWKTALCLILYVLIVLLRRQLWGPRQGVSDTAMFLPLVGPVNAAFLSEYGWLIFLLEVTPVMAIISGLLYLAQNRWSVRGQAIAKPRNHATGE